MSALIKCRCGCTPYKNESCLQWLLRRGVSLLLRVAPGSIPGGLIIFCWCLILHGCMALFGWVLNFACCMALFGWARAEARHAAWRDLGWHVAACCF